MSTAHPLAIALPVVVEATDIALLAGGLLVLSLAYLAIDSRRSGPRRDRKGRFRSRRRSRVYGLLKLGLVVLVLWVGVTTVDIV